MANSGLNKNIDTVISALNNKFDHNRGIEAETTSSEARTTAEAAKVAAQAAQSSADAANKVAGAAVDLIEVSLPTKFDKTGGTISGNTVVDGNLTVTGTINATISGSSDSAMSATKDSEGNVIASTYLKKSELNLSTLPSCSILPENSIDEGGQIELQGSLAYKNNISIIDRAINKVRIHNGTSEKFTVDITNGETYISGNALIGGDTLSFNNGTYTHLYAKDVRCLSRNVNNSYLQINGGVDFNHGASLELNGSETNNSGEVKVWAVNGSSSSCLRLYPNGKATINDANILTDNDYSNFVTTNTKQIISSEKVFSNSNAFRLRNDNCSTIFRSDGESTWILLTAVGDPDGTWTNPNVGHPIRIEHSTGKVYINARDMSTVSTMPNYAGAIDTGSANYYTAPVNGWWLGRFTSKDGSNISVYVNNVLTHVSGTWSTNYPSLLVPVSKGDVIHYTLGHSIQSAWFYPCK